MKTNTINCVKQMPKTVWQKLKKPALVAAVALPTMAATQGCGPLLFFPWFCPPVPCCPAPVPYCPPAPIIMPVPVPVPVCGPCCDTTSVETAKKELDVLG